MSTLIPLFYFNNFEETWHKKSAHEVVQYFPIGEYFESFEELEMWNAGNIEYIEILNLKHL